MTSIMINSRRVTVKKLLKSIQAASFFIIICLKKCSNIETSTIMLEKRIILKNNSFVQIMSPSPLINN